MTCLLTLAVTVLVPAATAADTEDATAAAIRKSIERSLPYLASDGRAWMDGRIEMQDGKNCVSCHYVAFGVWSHEAASRAGLPIERKPHEQLTADAIEFVAQPDRGRLVTYSHLIMATKRPSASQQQHFEQYAAAIVKLQEDDGFWQAKGQFPSQDREVMESNAVASMWALVATKQYEKQKAVANSRRRALTWLENSTAGVSSEWHSWRLLVANLDQRRDVPARTEALLKLQRKDGGWNWRDDKPSDAYSTGQALFALLSTGTPADSPPIRRAVDFLLATQGNDGKWTVPSELISAGPDENKDQIYSYWGTAWSTIALCKTSELSLQAAN